MRTTLLRLAIVLGMFTLVACSGNQQAVQTGGQTNEPSKQNMERAETRAEGQSETSPATEHGPLEKPKIVVGSSVFSLGFLPLYVADARGLFDDEGLEVEVQYFNSGTQAFQAQVAGALDIGAQGPNQPIDAMLANQNFKAFWSTSNYPAYEWWSAHDIETLEDARNRNIKVGISQAGSLSHLISVYALQNSGFDIEGKVSFVAVGGSSARMAALESGQVDLVPASPPENFLLAKANYNKLIELKNILDEFEWDLYMADDDFLKDNPNTVRAFLRANVEAVKFIRSNPEGAAKIYAELVGYKPEQLEDVVAAVQELADYFPIDGHFAEEGIDVMLGFYKDSGDIEEIPEHGAFINFKYVDEFKQ